MCAPNLTDSYLDYDAMITTVVAKINKKALLRYDDISIMVFNYSLDV
jgi:hypothetical protein